ncbi:MAG: tRNA (guanosine(46)-N7)-methyltransferase TrmB [Candidatus Fimivivens sp.]
MRIRRKPWARQELAESPFVIDCPDDCRGHWKTSFAHPEAPLHLELGCGKGGFIAQKAFENPDVNFLAVDLKSEVLGLAKRNAERVYAEGGRTVDNLRLAVHNIEWIDHMLAAEDQIAKIYINFCNPWPKKRDFKHRLTHPRQLALYKKFLLPGHRLLFKTDDDVLFDATGEYLIECGFKVIESLADLPASHQASAIMTEHERMFRDEGLPIHYIAAVLPEGIV